MFGNSADEYLKVHDQGPGHADVTEGSGGIWERLHYDWSDPNRVVMTTTDSNLWGGNSGHTYTLTRQADGTTDVDVRRSPRGQEPQGTGARDRARDGRQARPGEAFEKTVKAIEARNNGARTAEPTSTTAVGGVSMSTPLNTSIEPRFLRSTD